MSSLSNSLFTRLSRSRAELESRGPATPPRPTSATPPSPSPLSPSQLHYHHHHHNHHPIVIIVIIITTIKADERDTAARRLQGAWRMRAARLAVEEARERRDRERDDASNALLSRPATCPADVPGAAWSLDSMAPDPTAARGPRSGGDRSEPSQDPVAAMPAE